MDAIGDIERRFGISLKQATRYEWCGPCPNCGGDDRFRFWTDKLNWYCRPGPGHCGKKGFIGELLDDYKPPTKAEKLARRIAEIERKQREHERRLSQLEKMHQCQDHIRYHQALDDRTLEYWFGEGIYEDTINRYLLGYCESCPTYRESPSYTIPVINRGKLENIRHRLTQPNGTGKYRPHLAGLGSSLFNVDLLDQAADRILIVEGEKKSIVLAQAGFPNVGITGKRSFKRQWLAWFARVREIVIALDPDATESAHRLAAMFGERARVAVTPVKIDDAIVKYRASESDIKGMLKWARQTTT